MMRQITAILTILLSASACFASGWNDFTLDIGDGYYVFKASSMDVCIGKTGGPLILSPGYYDGVGPVTGYITTPELILTKNLGRKPRNLFEGDKHEEVDPSREYFFVITKGTDKVQGPFSEEEFGKRPEVTNLGPLDWQTPTNPNFWLPLLGVLMFIAVAIPILAIKFFWITVPAIIGLIFLTRNIRKKRKAKGPTRGWTGIV